jgi:hypothetical protein
MASRPVSPQYLKAGEDYRDALISLGLLPAFLGWGWDPLVSQWILVLVTSIVDAGGPLALNRLLFRAYNAKATPKEISPFIVRVFSPELIPGGRRSSFWFLGSKNLTATSPKLSEPAKIQNLSQTFMGLELEAINSYETLPSALDNAYKGYHAQRHDWQIFRRNVERLAA